MLDSWPCTSRNWIGFPPRWSSICTASMATAPLSSWEHSEPTWQPTNQEVCYWGYYKLLKLLLLQVLVLQYIVERDIKFKSVNVTSGVPQGSTLGPLLLFTYVNSCQSSRFTFLFTVLSLNCTISTLSIVVPCRTIGAVVLIHEVLRYLASSAGRTASVLCGCLCSWEAK